MKIMNKDIEIIFKTQKSLYELWRIRAAYKLTNVALKSEDATLPVFHRFPALPTRVSNSVEEVADGEVH